MQYQFGNFQFDSEKLVLTKHGTPVDIRHNEARVLALLLERDTEVLSKDEILSHVWQDKVVSEQAVFQNISHLRNLFGNDAIKTFSKRGYQWQIEFHICQPETENAQIPNQGQNTTPSTAQQTPLTSFLQTFKLQLATVATVFFVLLLLAIYKTTFEPSPRAATYQISYLPITSSDDASEISLVDNNDFDFTRLNETSSIEFRDSSELEYPKLAKHHPFILSGELREFNTNRYLDFTLKGPFADWSGQISAKTNSEVSALLVQHLAQPFIYELLGAPQAPELELANLSIAHQSAPADLIILGRLVNAYITIEEFDKAMIMADKMATIALENSDHQQLGNALLYQSRVLTNTNLYELSSEKLQTAIERFEEINDLKRLADVWNAQSWLDHKLNGYEQVKTSLLTSAKFALAAKDKPRELHALTYLSVMAHKHQQADDKYSYLRMAENKMKAYELPIYHFAKVPFHYAIFADTPSAKEPHLKQVLEYAELTPDHWVAQSSRIQLLQHYIAQDRLGEATALVTKVKSDNAENSYLKTLLAQALGRTEDFVRHAQRAFEQAKLAGEMRLSLDIALMLMTAPNTKVNYDFYSQYIEDNANKHWRRDNKKQLLALKLP